ncbi:hypothetical protein [Microtetraspora malaysiensis]|nr:hypothetical protein [Microtetraspora malaysiensis]
MTSPDPAASPESPGRRSSRDRILAHLDGDTASAAALEPRP